MKRIISGLLATLVIMLMISLVALPAAVLAQTDPITETETITDTGGITETEEITDTEEITETEEITDTADPGDGEEAVEPETLPETGSANQSALFMIMLAVIGLALAGAFAYRSVQRSA